MKLTSPEFIHQDMIPKKFTCDGENVSPTLEIEEIPKNTESLALIVDDPDAPIGTFVHWVMFNMPVSKTIEENTAPGKQGVNDFKKQQYGGPCPPSGTHRYFFKLYALDQQLDLNEGITKEDLEKAMEGHIIEETELVGKYKRT